MVYLPPIKPDLVDLLHKVNSFISIAQIWQLPLVIFIMALCSRAVNVLNIKQLSTISLAFTFNLCYIICDFLSARTSPFFPFFNFNDVFLVRMAVIFDLLTTLCFLLATVSWYYGADLRLSRGGATWYNRSIFRKSDKTRKMLVPVLGPFVLLAAFEAMGLFSDQFWLHAVRSLYSFTGLFGVFLLFRNWEGRHVTRSRISYSFLLWAVLQWLDLFSGLVGENIIQAIGFSLSLVAKFFIIAGLFSWYLNFALLSAQERDREQVQKEQFFRSSQYFGNILANTFHELNFPLRNLGISLDRLHKFLSRDARVKFQDAENHYEQVRAVIAVARSSYSRDGRIITDPEEQDPERGTTKVVRVNNLLAFAIRSVKSIYEDQVHFSLEYGGKCYIECVPSKIIQIFLNLLKNAVESYPPTETKREIRVRSFVNKATDNRQVVVEIEDSGSGIRSDLGETIWNSGVSTKDPDDINTVRGQGLFVVRDFIDNTPGATIGVISPCQQNDQGESYGTLFTLTFPKKQLPELLPTTTATS